MSACLSLLEQELRQKENPIPAGQEEPEIAPKMNDRLISELHHTPGVSHLQIKHCASLIKRTALITSNTQILTVIVLAACLKIDH